MEFQARISSCGNCPVTDGSSQFEWEFSEVLRYHVDIQLGVLFIHRIKSLTVKSNNIFMLLFQHAAGI